MSEIVFKGKEYVYNHHLTVPYRPLVVDKAKGVGPGDLASNLVRDRYRWRKRHPQVSLDAENEAR